MNNSTKKRSVRLVAALLAIVMVIGGTFAFFTDSASINKSGNAGTVDVELDATGINLLDEDGKLILNPGDGRDVDFTVNNKGNKSVDIRTIITLTSSVGMAKDGQAEYEIYKLGDVEFVDGKGYMPKEGAQPLQVRSISEDGRTIVYQTPIYILNGNEELDDMEREIEPDVATDIDPYFDVSEGGSSANSKYVLVFKGSSANAFQASDVTLNVHIDAKQHRNQNGWVEVGNDDTEVPGADEDQETYNVQYVVSGIDDATLVIPYLSSSLTDDTSKFYAGVETGCYVDPNTEHADWNGEMYEVTNITVTTKSGTPIELDTNNRFITPAEDIIVTVEVEESDAIAAVYSTDRTFIGEYDNLDDAFMVAEQTAANDAATTSSTFGRTILAGLIPTAFAEPEVNVYVEMLTDYAMDEHLVISSPYTITFTSNEAALNAAGKDHFTLYANSNIINVTSVSSMVMENIVFDGVSKDYSNQMWSLIENYGTLTIDNAAIKNFNIGAHLLYSGAGSTIFMNDFTVSNCEIYNSDVVIYSAGDIHMSGNIDLHNNYTNYENIIMMDYTSAKPAIHCADNLKVDTAINTGYNHDGTEYGYCVCTSLDCPLNGTTMIYASNENLLKSFNLKGRTAIENGINYGTFYYCDGELYLCRAPYYAFDDANKTYTVECFGVPKIDLYTYILADGTPCDANTPGAYELVQIEASRLDIPQEQNLLEELIVPDDFTGSLFLYNNNNISKVYINSNLTGITIGLCEKLTQVTTKNVDGAVVIGPNVTHIQSIPAEAVTVDLKDSNITTFDSLSNSVVQSIKLPEGITEIPSGSFANATSLKHIALPSTVTYIDQSFYGCTSLEYVVITSPSVTVRSNSSVFPATTTIYYTGEEGGITGLYSSLKKNLVYADSNTTLNVTNGILTGFKTDKYNVPTLDLSNISYINADGELETITGYGANLLANNTNTTHVIFPANYTADKFDINVIKNAPAVESVTFKAEGYADVIDSIVDTCDLTSATFVKNSEEITAYPVIKGITVDADGKIIGMSSDISGEFVLTAGGCAKTPDGKYVKVTGLGSNAFAGSKVTSVIIPVEFSSIPSDAFAGCNTLTTVTIKNSLVYSAEFVQAVLDSNPSIQTVNMAVADYTRLDYIYTTGQNSYMNTGLKPTINTDIKINYMVPKDPKATAAIFGAGDANLGGGMCYLHIYQGTTGAAGKPALYGMANCGVFGQKCTVTMIGNTYSFYVNGELLLERSNDTAASFTAPTTMVLGCANAGGNIKYPLAAYIYDFQYYENGELVLDWVPAMVNGVAGMYNRVDGSFKAGGGSGVVAGSEIHNPDAEMQSFSR